jgi:hypothetical protein
MAIAPRSRLRLRRALWRVLQQARSLVTGCRSFTRAIMLVGHHP